MFEPIARQVARQRLLRQRKAAQALQEILERAVPHGLPQVSWQLGPVGSVVGQFLNSDVDERLPGFMAWAQFLGIDDWQSYDAEGVTYLHGVAGLAFHGLAPRRCRVVITAQIPDTADGGDRR